MERKKFCAGLIAVAMGLAFSFGSASAYEQGDFADGATEGKLIPYYKAGENMATIIGVDNQAGGADGVVNIIEVAAFDETGTMQASGELCLADNQFGYAVLQEEAMDDGGTRVGLLVGVGDETASIYGLPGSETTTGAPDRAGSDETREPGEGTMIAAEGYVVVRDLGTYTTDADQDEDDTDTANDGCDSTGTITDPSDTTVKFATWAILQDVGEGSFFGTEIPTATVDAVAPTPDAASPDSDGVTCDTPADDCPGLIAAAQVVTARFDTDMANDSASTIYVWLDTAVAPTYDTSTGEETTTPRELDAMVYCEGEDAASMDLTLMNNINVVDASTLGCDARGVVQITLPADTVADAGLVWSHIAQMGGGFRMSFAGYEAAP